MLVSGVSFFGCENFFTYEEKGHERMRKKAIYIGVAVAVILVAGGMAAYGYYDSKYMKFEDEYIESNTLDVLNIKSDRVLKTQAKELRYFEIFENNLKNIRTLEDLEKFPKLEVLVNHGIRDYETEEGKKQFEKYFKPTLKEYARYQEMLKATLPKLKNLKEVSFGSRTIFYDLDAFAECTQIEELWVEHNQIENVEGIAGMKSLRILSLAHNKVADISAFKELENLEAVNLESVEVQNLQDLLEIPSLKLVLYEAKNEEEARIITELCKKGVKVLEEKEGEEGFVEALEELGIERLGYEDIKDMNKEAEMNCEK